MINWDNIGKEIQENYDDNDSLLQYIKDEIGTCETCTFYNITAQYTHKGAKQYPDRCDKLIMAVDKYFYCADFKKETK